MYVLHDNDGTIMGVITGDKNYGEHLSKFGHQWIFLAENDDSRIFNFDTMTNYVDVEKKNAGVPHPDCLCPKGEIAVFCDRRTIASGSDTATISGIPAGASVTVISDVGVEFDGTVDDGSIELVAETPATYTVHVTAGARYMPASIQVVAQ